MLYTKISAILLSAGLSSRMAGRDKLHILFKGKTLLERAVSLLDCLPFHEKIMVTTAERLMHVSLPIGIRPIINPMPWDGQSSSLRLGVKAASGEFFLFMAADQPLLDKDVLLALINAAEENHGKIIYPTSGCVPSSPALFPAEFREELLSLSGDVGGRSIMRKYPKSCYPVEIEKAIKLQDIDTQKDLLLLADAENKNRSFY